MLAPLINEILESLPQTRFDNFFNNITPSMSYKSLPPITVGKDEYAERVAQVIAEAFAGDALNRAAILSKDSLPNDTVISRERWIEHVLPSIQSKVAVGAHLVEAGDWAAVALW